MNSGKTREKEIDRRHQQRSEKLGCQTTKPAVESPVDDERENPDFAKE
jgi:hypothetical protein